MESKLLQKILDKDSRGIFVYQDGEYKYVNQIFLSLLGYEEEDIQNANYLDHVEYEYYPKIKKLINYCSQNRISELPNKIKYKAIKKDDGSLWVELIPRIIDYKGEPALLGHICKTNVQKVKLNKSRFSAKNMNSSKREPKIFYVIDREGKFLFISDTIKSIGWNPKKLIGKHFKNILHPEDVESVSSKYVLPKYESVITGDKMAPKLFDERRTGARKTKNLKVKLVPKSNQKNDSYFSTVVVASGVYNAPVHSKDKRQIGTAGIIRKA